MKDRLVLGVEVKDIKPISCAPAEMAFNPILTDESIEIAQRVGFKSGIHPDVVFCCGITTPMHQKCPDCNGSGRYTGFNAVEKCKACGGSGIKNR